MLRILSIILVVLLSTGVKSYSQGPVYDVVSAGAGYTNQSFYSLQNGEVSNVSNTDWDLAFQISGFQASILVNGKNNVRLFRSGIDVNGWSNITANDTVGALNPANELLNQDTSWWSGAFNITNDVSNPFDLGWGVYDFATHAVTGDSLYFIKLSTGVVKKLWMQSLSNSTYYFAYADIDGSNEVNTSLYKQNFIGKNFGYFSFATGMTIDREPNKYSWDLTFAQYMSTTPITYKVTGVLSNDSVTALKVYPVDVTTASPWGGGSFSKYINTIGYEWKSFDFNSNTWAIEDSVVYFVNDRPGNLWKVVFTGFGGSASGNFEFYKEQISSTGVAENGGKPALLNIYPNPSNGVFNLVCYIDKYTANNSASLIDINGKAVKSFDLSSLIGLSQTTLEVRGIAAGVYSLQLIVDGTTSTKRIVITE